MRRANGNGGITKVSGTRRKPYKVMITKGWNPDTGGQIKKLLGYFATQKEANKALADYLDTPYDLELSNITFEDVYNKWNSIKFKSIGHSAHLGYIASFKNIENLHKMKMKDIKTRHLQKAIDDSNKGHGSRRKIKVLFNQLYAYAIQNDIISKDYSSFVEIGKKEGGSTRVPFSSNEIKKLWEHLDTIDFIDTILIMIYSGLRIGELLEIETSNVDIKNMTIKGGLKTDAGKNRIIPIHPKIYKLIERRYNIENKYLIVNYKNEQMKYSNYLREKFEPIMTQLNIKHRPHDCRHTFATLLNNANANSTAIKKMVGHSNFSTTEKIYTHKDVEELRKNIKLID